MAGCHSAACTHATHAVSHRDVSCLGQEYYLENDKAAYVIRTDLAQAQRSLLGRRLDSHIKPSDQLSRQIGIHIAHLHHLQLSASAAWLLKTGMEAAAAATSLPLPHHCSLLSF